MCAGDDGDLHANLGASLDLDLAHRDWLNKPNNSSGFSDAASEVVVEFAIGLRHDNLLYPNGPVAVDGTAR
jgi:hypothetical protein